MEHSFLIQILLMLVIAIVSIAILRRAGLPAILAYLITGVISGPSGFHWFTQHQMQSVAELGVVLLMFSLGLEFSLPRLWAMRRTVFGLGSAQVIVTTIISMAIALLCNLSVTESVVVGSAIALSSTAIVLKLLNEQGWLRRRHGELSVSVLLFQDIAVVPLLILLPLLASDGEALLWNDVVFALFKGVLAFIALMAFGKWALPKLFDEVARSRSNELFVLSTLVVALVTGAITQWLGLSMALGAFMAGMLLGESQYRRQLEADIRPFRDLLMGLFFISIGMLLDFELVAQYWWQIIFILIAVILGKALVIFGLLKIAKESFRSSVATALSLAQVGEFSFVVLALAVNYQLLDGKTSTTLVMVAVLSMALAPWLVRHSVDIARMLQGLKPKADKKESLNVTVDAKEDLVLILGYGRVGQTIARFMKTEAIPYLVLDLDPTRVSEARAAGEPVYFGDVSKRSILKQAKVRDAKLIVITFSSERILEEVLPLCRQLAPDANILVRTRDDSGMEALEEAGASQVIPETLEGSLMLVSQVLYQCGVPLARILKRLEIERRNHYQYLHGFFSGAETDFTLELLHAVALPKGANAVGQTLADIPWQKLKVELRAVRRAGAEVESPELDWQIKAGDILILLGKPRRIEKAEIFLLQG
ncbi:monovalent cation:proton antiporter-2 (CPA2) family protein [Shewanella fidelis]|uniref:Monovalent cation:proton antiporter-2 (CPA2) family protein n=1 Tax=Shewanella fidelis TaxID=173509 RepID=A0AAW8NIC7_9GAMM|nr:monovalent cation:proton antiporter-2 (CPA2) family protein [Shewanella fidelis]MDR8523088.1 monovalent cation:proton antiporter-2 (CPA2) family protein [Shewanella fidelis]MDW4811586.1 monovalent cation:proton antiporter-2 (CPA2) family protein [Shewanella fidelis]MDW4815707.1 monovalent cation:proton antiporter-2 (CPA2) family protein [Shewanella fidelis]MDW4819797.1 monovalent cation:proton antiporter-2 (CPA2) family protein [Shewanella fidelis]MDW4824229.1 monovalent cation:proton antip